jgi:multidrug efflux pump subunit AcrB
MRSIIKWAIANSPAMNTFLIASLIVGTVSMVVMRREVFPAFNLEILLVQVPFPGATPAEVEDGICQKIESAVANVDGVRKMTSVAKEGFGFVVLELDGNISDVQKVLDEVRSEIDQVQAFLPPKAEEPKVNQIVFRAPSISVGIVGPELPKGVDRNGREALESERQLRDLAEEVRAELLELRPVPPANPGRRIFAPLFQPTGPAVSSAEIAAERPFEISVEVHEDTLRQFGISLPQFAQMIRTQNTDIPGGKMITGSQEMLLRGNNKREDGIGIADLPAITKPDGDVVRVGDIADVVDGFAETTSINLINGRPGLVIQVAKTNKEDLFTVVEAVKNYVANKQVPAGYKIETWGDISVDVVDRINLLSRNGIQGLILVFVVLAIFLELRLAFWVAMGIPISILGAGFVLLAFGQTMNMLSMFAFLMALGFVVDDAIVIGENIYNKREIGMTPVQAAIEGTVEVLPSVTASVTTTIIAFTPLMYVSGVMGKFIAIMPLAVIAMLVISLVESMFILPAHLAHENNLFIRTLSSVFYIFKPLLVVFNKLNAAGSAAMSFVIGKVYEPLLRFSLNNRIVVVATCLGAGILCGGMVFSGGIPVGVFPKLDGQEISGTIVFPNGTSSAFSRDGVGVLRDAMKEIDREIQESGHPTVIANMYENIGEVGDAMKGPTGVTNGSHVGSVTVLLTPPGERDYTTRELIAKWREAVPKVAGTEVLKFGARSMGPGGAAVEFKLLADDKGVEFLEEAGEECKKWLAGKAGVFDIEDDMRLGKWERSLRLNEEGQALGLTQEDLSETIRSIYFGNEVMRLQRGRHEVKLMVRYPRDQRQTQTAFEEIRVRDSQGNERPITEVAEFSHKRELAEINRLDQRRCITITADVDKTQANARQLVEEMKADFLPGLLQSYRDKHGASLSVNWEGEQAQNDESVQSMGVGFMIALLCMYILLTLQFRSYLQPLIIMSIIPFGFLGAILGHGIVGLEITLFSFFGLIALTGVVVNDSIVLVDFINARVRSGIPLKEALAAAGSRRFRPIMLTSMTTIAGLFPMLMETSVQAQVLIPMAVSLIYGLLFGTLLILILVPVFYSIYGSFLGWFGVSLVQDLTEGYKSPPKPQGYLPEASPAYSRIETSS